MKRIINLSAPAAQAFNGRGLRHRHLDRHQRAELAAAWVAGEIQISPAIWQAAALLEVPVTEVRKHLKARKGNDRNDRTTNGNGHNLRPETLAEHFARSSPSEWLAVARAAGVDMIWDHMISPIVDAVRSEPNGRMRAVEIERD